MSAELQQLLRIFLHFAIFSCFSQSPGDLRSYMGCQKKIQMVLSNLSKPTKLEAEIRALENAYAEILATDADPLSLKLVHQRLNVLKRAALLIEERQSQNSEHR